MSYEISRITLFYIGILSNLFDKSIVFNIAQVLNLIFVFFSSLSFIDSSC